MTPPGIPHYWLLIWCLKCCAAFPVACGVINCHHTAIFNGVVGPVWEKALSVYEAAKYDY
jgi:hypothetical protein